MNREPVTILLVENDPRDAEFLRALFANVATVRFDLEHTDTLEEALAYLSERHFDLLLLDLSLPDGASIDPFLRIRTQAPDVPIIVLTERQDESLGLKLVQMGAQDYLVKHQIDDKLLVRAVRYAIERQRLQHELDQVRQQEQYNREFRSLEELARSARTSVTSRLFGAIPLRESLPEIFHELVQRYEALLDLALEQRTYKVEYKMSEDLRSIADQLGFLKAGPRDVVKIHSTALKSRAGTATPMKARAYVEEGRLMVLELMGYLVSYYRTYALGVSSKPLDIPETPPKPQKEAGHE